MSELDREDDKPEPAESGGGTDREPVPDLPRESDREPSPEPGSDDELDDTADATVPDLPDEPGDAALEAHKHELGFDPDTGRYREAEAETGLRVEAERDLNLERAPQGGADWRDEATGETYDAVGNFHSDYFEDQWPHMQEQIKDHLNYKAEYVPVDVSQFTSEQRQKVEQFITDNEDDFRGRVFTVGG